MPIGAGTKDYCGMMMNNIEKELLEAFRRFDKDGDGSLEYYGMVIRNGYVSGTKLYRRPSIQSDENELTEKYRKHPLFSEITQYAKIYDFSTLHDQNGDTKLRMVFAPRLETSLKGEQFDTLLSLCGIYEYAFFFTKLINYYTDRRFTGTSPLLKMGVELGTNGKATEAKAYFALRKFDKKYDSYGRRMRYTNCKEYVDESLRLLGMGDLIENFRNIALQMEENEYYPVFTGINFSNDGIEMKVYYETVFPNYHIETVVGYENRLADLMLLESEKMKSMHSNIIKTGAFLDCVSYSIMRRKDKQGDDVLWKPYYLRLTRKLAQIRRFERQSLTTQHISMDAERFKIVLVVDDDDKPCGFMDKLQAHQIGARHRAFSVFLHDGKGNMLVQRRAKAKYHSPEVISNACCSHPLTSQVIEEAKLRLKEEIGIHNILLREIFVFPYKGEVGSGLVENEIDHVIIGVYSGEIMVNTQESEEAWYMSFDEIERLLVETPKHFSLWFRLVANRVIQYIREGGGHEN